MFFVGSRLFRSPPLSKKREAGLPARVRSWGAEITRGLFLILEAPPSPYFKSVSTSMSFPLPFFPFPFPFPFPFSFCAFSSLIPSF